MNSNPGSQYLEPSTMTQRRVFTVSELTANIKVLLEDRFPFIWICGEISNLRVPASGHFYFTLKDKSNVPWAEPKFKIYARKWNERNRNWQNKCL